MAKILSIKVTYDSRKVIENARKTCPVCEHVNKKVSKRISGRESFGRINIQETIYSEKCEVCESKWEVVTDECDE